MKKSVLVICCVLSALSTYAAWDAKSVLDKAAAEFTWFDGKTMWSYVKDNEEVNVTEPKPAQLAKMNPYAFIDMYKKGYDIAFGTNTKAYFEVVLTSTNAKNSIQKAIIRINRMNYQPTYIIMGGSKADIEIKVTSYKKGKKQADSTFRFNKSKYPNAEIIDLR